MYRRCVKCGATVPAGQAYPAPCSRAGGMFVYGNEPIAKCQACGPFTGNELAMLASKPGVRCHQPGGYGGCGCSGKRR